MADAANDMDGGTRTDTTSGGDGQGVEQSQTSHHESEARPVSQRQVLGGVCPVHIVLQR